MEEKQGARSVIHPMALEIAETCNSIVAGWNTQGWVNDLEIGDKIVSVLGNGGYPIPSEIFVSVKDKGSKDSEYVFCRSLDRDGTCKMYHGEDAGKTTIVKDAKKWMIDTIKLALRSISN